MAMSQPIVLRPTFEHHPDGFGVGHTNPRISWRFSHGKIECKDWKQTAYDVEVVRSQQSNGKIYNVKSSESTLVPWPCDPLQSRERAYIRVRTYGQDGTSSNSDMATVTAWSEVAVVEAALLNQHDWLARPIVSSKKPPRGGPLPPVRFRREFSLTDNVSITKARLYVTAFGVYECHINGTRVGNQFMSPGWTSYNHRLSYQVFDVTELLQTKNALTIEVAEGWYAGRLAWLGDKRYFYGEELAVMAQLEIDPSEGDNIQLVTDETWKSNSSAIVSSQIYDGEHYDLRKEEDGWQHHGYHDETWTSTQSISFPQAKLVTPDAPPVRITQSLSPVEIFTSPTGKTIVDFGQNLVGVVRIENINLPKDTTLKFIHTEVLEDGEAATRPLRSAGCTDTITGSGKELKGWHPKFTFHGFRYVQIDGWPGTPTPKDLSALVLHSDMRRRGFFSCSNALINKLHENIVWGMRGNFLAVPTDCPQRDERLGWTGDLQVFAPTASFLYDTMGMLSNWLEDLAVDQNENGIVGLVVPDILQNVGFNRLPQAVWHDVSILTPWDLYCYSSDLHILKRQYQSMKSYLDTIPRGEDNMWHPLAWQLGDWLDPAAPPDKPGDGRTKSLLVADAYLVRVTFTFAKVCSRLGLDGEASLYNTLASKLRETFQNKYITPAGNMLSDSQTAISLGICFGLYPPSFERPNVGTSANPLEHAAKSLSQLVRISQFRISTGFVGTPLILPALTLTSNSNIAYRMLLERRCPSWLYPVTMGATTVWERWDSMLPNGKINPGDMTSFNHYALGSVANWIHQTVGGLGPSLRPGEEGWKVVSVTPIPGGNITSATTKFDGPFGMVQCTWNIDDAKTFNLKVEVPPNSRARVYLPTSPIHQTLRQGDGATLSDDDAILVGSGYHEFTCNYQLPEDWPPKGLSVVPFWDNGAEEPFEC